MLAYAVLTAVAVVLDSPSPGNGAVHADDAALARRFTGTVRPFLEQYCFACHGEEKQKGRLDLSAWSDVAAVLGDLRRFEAVRRKLAAAQMPPAEAERQPPPELRAEVLEWIRALRRREAERNAGDPGPVFARRLSNAEYDHSIRDLTGVDLRPAREFPVDPANEAGFDNSGESLAMSPALLEKYLEAARRVAEHLVLKPRGFAFAPHPVVTDSDRDKYCVKRIVDFYARQPTDLAAYFLSAWRFRHRAALGRPEETLAESAARDAVSPKYLATIWSALEGTGEEVGPLSWLQGKWRELPPPGDDEGDGGERAARRGCEEMRELVIRLRPQLQPVFRNLASPGIAPGSQPFVLWKDRQYAVNRRSCSTRALRIEAEPLGDRPPDFSSGEALVLPHDEAARRRLEEALARFCSVFPDAFYVAERGLIFLPEDNESEGRLLSAGFHLMFGYFRDDAPLCELILDEEGRRELDSLWDELRFVTHAPQRQYKDYLFFERAEPPRFMIGAQFDFARPEDRESTSEPKIRRLAEAYLAEARRRGGKSAALEAIEQYFRDISAEIRWVETTARSAEASHLEALLEFAERAWRRPLPPEERADVLGFYRSLRERDRSSHEDALRDAVASILVSPHFCYRLDLAPPGDETAPVADPDRQKGRLQTIPLPDHALASRLSYFLWASLPDRALVDRAAAGDLHRPEVLVAEARRMLRDDRVRGLATEFCAHWLDFRRFEELNTVDRDRFRCFTNDLRRSMFEEPLRFFMDLVREDRPVLDLLYADHTFVDRGLARHYGMPDGGFAEDGWRRIDGARRYGRGGLLPMAAFLTQNSPGLRTSPVKRGYWVVRRVLGEVIPPPPPSVPQLPADEGKLGELTLRETLERHRQDPACSGCHERFDSLGLVFEGYGPVGERRDRDLGGRPVDVRAAFPGGFEGAGLEGLLEYLRGHRQEEFLDNFCRKLLAYALGRSLILSDDPLIEAMRAKLAAGGYRFGGLVEEIVTSPQFLRRRGPPDLAE